MTFNTWQKNLAANFLAELLAMTAFTFVDPILPLYIQRVGDFSVKEAAFWSGIAASGLGIAMFLISPIWGMLADRFGRKPMVMRAMFGGAIILSLMGVTSNIYVIIVLRWLQGLITGSVTAMTALASSLVPRERISFAMGIIMLAVYGGMSIGPLIGGYVADHAGYRVTFYLSGVFLLLAGVSVSLMVKENFQKPAQNPRNPLGEMLRRAMSRQMLPLLVVMCLLSVGRSLVSPIISLRVKQIDLTGQAATISGLIYSLTGLMAAISSVVGGRLGDRISLTRIIAVCSFIIALFYLPPVWASTIGLLGAFLIATGLLQGALMTSTNAMVGSSVTPQQQGTAYGMGQSASSLGSGLGPIIGGSLASAIGLNPIFGIAAGVYALAGIVTIRCLSRRLPNPS